MLLRISGLELLVEIWEPDGFFKPGLWITGYNSKKIIAGVVTREAWIGPFHFMLCTVNVNMRSKYPEKDKGVHGHATEEGNT